MSLNVGMKSVHEFVTVLNTSIFETQPGGTGGNVLPGCIQPETATRVPSERMGVVGYQRSWFRPDLRPLIVRRVENERVPDSRSGGLVVAARHDCAAVCQLPHPAAKDVCPVNRDRPGELAGERVVNPRVGLFKGGRIGAVSPQEDLAALQMDSVDATKVARLRAARFVEKRAEVAADHLRLRRRCQYAER